jgi:hypothetical protein
MQSYYRGTGARLQVYRAKISSAVALYFARRVMRRKICASLWGGACRIICSGRRARAVGRNNSTLSRDYPELAHFKWELLQRAGAIARGYPECARGCSGLRPTRRAGAGYPRRTRQSRRAKRGRRRKPAPFCVMKATIPITLCRYPCCRRRRCPFSAAPRRPFRFPPRAI